MSGRHLAQGWRLLPAARLGVGAARVEVAAGRGIGGVGDLAGQRDVVRGSGLVYRARMLRLPLRDAGGRVRLLIAASDEAPHSSAPSGAGMPAVTTIAGRFIDIGAGVPDPTAAA